jgi:hypothetical protein
MSEKSSIVNHIPVAGITQIAAETIARKACSASRSWP